MEWIVEEQTEEEWEIEKVRVKKNVRSLPL